MTRAAALTIAAVLALAGCGGDDDTAPAVGDRPAPADQTQPSETVNDLRIDVIEFGPGGSGIYVGIQVTNDGDTEARLDERSFVVIAPDGTELPAYVDPASAGYRLLNPGGVYVTGYNFELDTFEPGEYRLTYDGAELETKTL